MGGGCGRGGGVAATAAGSPPPLAVRVDAALAVTLFALPGVEEEREALVDAALATPAYDCRSLVDVVDALTGGAPPPLVPSGGWVPQRGEATTLTGPAVAALRSSARVRAAVGAHPRWPALAAAATTAMYAGHTPPSPCAPPCDGPSPLSHLVCALLRVPDAGALDALVAAAAALSAASAVVPALLADRAVRGAAAEAALAAASPVSGAAAPVLLRHPFPALIHGRLIAVTAAAAAVAAAAVAAAASSVDPWAMPAAAAR